MLRSCSVQPPRPQIKRGQTRQSRVPMAAFKFPNSQRIPSPQISMLGSNVFSVSFLCHIALNIEIWGAGCAVRNFKFRLPTKRLFRVRIPRIPRFDKVRQGLLAKFGCYRLLSATKSPIFKICGSVCPLRRLALSRIECSSFRVFRVGSR